MDSSLYIDESTQFPDDAVSPTKEGEPPLPTTFPVEPKQEEPWGLEQTTVEQPIPAETVEPRDSEKSSDESTYSNKTFTCNTCKKSYTSNYGLRRHRKKVSHEETETKNCPPPAKVVNRITPLATVHFYTDTNNAIYMSVDK